MLVLPTGMDYRTIFIGNLGGESTFDVAPTHGIIVIVGGHDNYRINLKRGPQMGNGLGLIE
jgi:hypothetical protein